METFYDAIIIDAIEAVADLDNIQIAIDLQKLLSYSHYDFDCSVETKFSLESYQQPIQPRADHWYIGWSDFEKSLKTETRFFSQSASSLLKSIFTDIDKEHTDNGTSLIVNAGPNTKFEEVFRARCFHSDSNLAEALKRPEKSLGPPPPNLAGAGRMNAQGISVFYGATKQNVAIAEIRPPVGSKVVVARFEIIRRLKLLDLTALDSVVSTGSLFDPTYFNRTTKAIFLRTLSSKMTIPVMPNNETLEYLPTQAVADFLSSENVPQLDGIIFNSVQAEGNALNLVLFHKASSVQKGPEFKSVIVSQEDPSEKIQEDHSPENMFIDDWVPNSWDRSYILVDDENESIKHTDKWVSGNERDDIERHREENEDREESGEWEETEILQVRRSKGTTDNNLRENALGIDSQTQPKTVKDIVTEEENTKPPSLRIDIDSIEVHNVESVKFNSKTIPIHRTQNNGD